MTTTNNGGSIAALGTPCAVVRALREGKISHAVAYQARIERLRVESVAANDLPTLVRIIECAGELEQSAARLRLQALLGEALRDPLLLREIQSRASARSSAA